MSVMDAINNISAVNHYYCHRDDKVICVCCPLCGSEYISVAAESVVADSYFCDNCKAHFAVTAVFPLPECIVTTTTDKYLPSYILVTCAGEHDWDYTKNGTGHSAICRKCGAFRSVDGKITYTWGSW